MQQAAFARGCKHHVVDWEEIKGESALRHFHGDIVRVPCCWWLILKDPLLHSPPVTSIPAPGKEIPAGARVLSFCRSRAFQNHKIQPLQDEKRNRPLVIAGFALKYKSKAKNKPHQSLQPAAVNTEGAVPGHYNLVCLQGCKWLHPAPAPMLNTTLGLTAAAMARRQTPNTAGCIGARGSGPAHKWLFPPKSPQREGSPDSSGADPVRQHWGTCLGACSPQDRHGQSRQHLSICNRLQ